MTEETKITDVDHGPFLATGPAIVADAEGNRFRFERKTVVPWRAPKDGLYGGRGDGETGHD